MNIIHNNPYRIAGILSSATTREFERQKGRIKAYTKVGKEIKSDLDFQFLVNISRTEDSVNKAFSKVQQNQEKVNYSLFWFLNVSPFDNTAIEYLKNGDKEKAVEIWEKVTSDKNINSKNYSAFNNLGTYKLLSRYKTDIKAGIEAKIKLIESDYFENFVHTVADKTYTIDNQKQSEILIDELLTQLKNRYSSSDTLELFSGCKGDIKQYLFKKLAEEPLHKIENQIKSCKKKRRAANGDAYEFGLKLVTDCKDDLSFLNSLLGNVDIEYQAVADKLANEIMQCGIDYFNESRENNSNENYLDQAQKLTKIADRIATGKLTKDKAKDCLATLEEMKDQEVNKAVTLLSSIKLAYEKAISEIDNQVSQMLMTMSYNQTINYSKVDKMKANCLDWSKVVEVLSNGISANDVAIIQNCSNQSKVLDYKNLVDFLFSKLGPIQINKVKYLCYWKDVRAAQAKSTAKKIGRTAVDTASSANDASGGCLGEIFSRIIGFAIILFIIWLLSVIFD
ncbi:hypothetical protein [Algibacter luteus]|uniref:hypothetical protein n=1 Tax=Algibacter luteus TaxID=1178825 RepID=UPI0025944D3A|nr:hypothetical protein [Algibacter luteus]WJJ98223.1 hypothetical protein O5O44_07470 [Algibacter luteus]